MQIFFSPTGPPELRREDGWFYRLHGLGPIDCEFGIYDDARLVVTIYDLSDQTLDSIRVFRDAFPDYSIALHHDY